MNKPEIIGNFEIVKCKAQIIFCEWLKDKLPNWNNNVKIKVTKPQKKIIEQKNYNNLKQLDFAMLLYIIVNNWSFLMQKYRGNFTKAHKTYVQEMIDRRNGWSHKSTEDIEKHPPVGIEFRDISRDLDTIRRIIEAIDKDQTILTEISNLEKSINNLANPSHGPNPPLTPPDPCLAEFQKLNKIKKWASKPTQINHKMIKAYLELEKDGRVLLESFKEKCENQYKIKTFSTNYRSMKTDSGNSHGKIFYENTIYIFMYPIVRDEVKKFFNLH